MSVPRQVPSVASQVRTTDGLIRRPASWLSGLRLIAIIAAVCSLLPQALRGQAAWPGYPTNTAITVTSGGNIGIGTSSPGSKLAISGLGSNDGGQTDVQITGTSTVGGGINLISADTGGKNWGILSTGSATGIPGSLGFYDTSAGAYRFIVSSSGNVGIGTTNPQNALSVNGIVQAKEVLVNTGWSDYVFAPNYRLRPLSEVAAYIKQNQHLPDMPSAAEVENNGVPVGEMESKLLAKIEELTLHMIEAHQENSDLRRQNEELRKHLSAIDGQLARLAAKTPNLKRER